MELSGEHSTVCDCADYWLFLRIMHGVSVINISKESKTTKQQQQVNMFTNQPNGKMLGSIPKLRLSHPTNQMPTSTGGRIVKKSMTKRIIESAVAQSIRKWASVLSMGVSAIAFTSAAISAGSIMPLLNQAPPPVKC